MDISLGQLWDVAARFPLLVMILAAAVVAFAYGVIVNLVDGIDARRRRARLPERKVTRAAAETDWPALEKQFDSAHQPPEPGDSP